MYCVNCHKETPENFDTCIYCGTSLQPEKKAGILRYRNSLRQKVTPITIFSCFFTLCILAGVIFSIFVLKEREHPEKVAFNYAVCVKNNDASGLALLLPEEYINFRLRYVYYSREDFNEFLRGLLSEINGFYTKKCSEDFRIQCKVKEIQYAEKNIVSQINSFYKENLFFEKEIEKAARLKVIFEVKGKTGEYTTVITDFVCLKIGGAWCYALEFPNNLF
ncbi:MAG: hypothetical protein ACOX45_01570 [Acutalibacteraceae bacterium]